MSSRLEATRGLWIGLGIALVIMSFSAPIVIASFTIQESHRECIREHGNWNNQSNECTFEDKQ